jgi:hypothetical protein
LCKRHKFRNDGYRKDLQGIGLSAPGTISIAIIRDMYSGDYMARIMSFVTVVFMVPVIVRLWVNLCWITTTGMDFLYSGSY